MRTLQVILSSIMLFAVIGSSYQTIQLAKEHQALKIDLSDMNHIRYGLLNVDEWAGQVADIIAVKIEEFEITPENRENLQKTLEEVMYALVNEFEEFMKLWKMIM